MTTDVTLYTVTEAAKILGIHERNVRELVREGQLEAAYINGDVRVTKDSMDKLLPGYKNDPNPDQEIKKQQHPVKYDLQERERHELIRNKASKTY